MKDKRKGSSSSVVQIIIIYHSIVTDFFQVSILPIKSPVPGLHLHRPEEVSRVGRAVVEDEAAMM
jgi:hypothetical protein